MVTLLVLTLTAPPLAGCVMMRGRQALGCHGDVAGSDIDSAPFGWWRDDEIGRQNLGKR